jgi:hypothetical protein
MTHANRPPHARKTEASSPVPAGVLLLTFLLPSCTSLMLGRDHQEVSWSDGDQSRVEVWLRQGTTSCGQPAIFVLDTLATPALLFAEVTFAIAAASRSDLAIEGGPAGFLASLLPGFTCVPIDAKPTVRLRLDAPLFLPASSRDELAGLTSGAGVEWLARNYEALGHEGEGLGEQVRKWVARVNLVPSAGEAPAGADPLSSPRVSRRRTMDG